MRFPVNVSRVLQAARSAWSPGTLPFHRQSAALRNQLNKAVVRCSTRYGRPCLGRAVADPLQPAGRCAHNSSRSCASLVPMDSPMRPKSRLPGEPPSAFLLDMDGVLVYEAQALPGSADFISRLTSGGTPYMVLTNNSIFTPRDLRARLGRAGIHLSGIRSLDVRAGHSPVSGYSTSRRHRLHHRRSRIDHGFARYWLYAD